MPRTDDSVRDQVVTGCTIRGAVTSRECRSVGSLASEHVNSRYMNQIQSKRADKGNIRFVAEIGAS
jgi:hypothetical protein